MLDIVGQGVYGRDVDTLASIAGPILAERGWMLASAEFGTAGTLATEIGTHDHLTERYLGGLVLTKTGAPSGLELHDPVALARYARQQTGADVGIGPRCHRRRAPELPVAVDVRDAVATGEGARFNMPLLDLRRRAAVESLALLVKTLRETPA